VADREQRLPPNSIGSNTHLQSSAIINTTDENNVILHAWGEARTLQSGTPDSLEQLEVEIDRIAATIDSVLQELEEINGCLMEQRSVGNGDMINHVPRILLMVSQADRKGQK
jgi:hypothetical protein